MGEIENLDVQAGQLREVNYRAQHRFVRISGLRSRTSYQFKLSGRYLQVHAKPTPHWVCGAANWMNVYEQNLVNLIQAFNLGTDAGCLTWLTSTPVITAISR